MSYIDTLKHKVLGEIAYLPVYLLEQDDLGENNEFNSPKGTILLGGGGGEHPALSIKNHNIVVLNYLNNLIDSLKPEDMGNVAFEKYKREYGIDELEEKTLDLLDEYSSKDNIEYDYYNVLQFNDWSMDNYADLVIWRRENDSREYFSTEEWLNIVVGEFIVNNVSELNNFKELFEELEILKINLNNQENDLSL